MLALMILIKAQKVQKPRLWYWVGQKVIQELRGFRGREDFSKCVFGGWDVKPMSLAESHYYCSANFFFTAL